MPKAGATTQVAASLAMQEDPTPHPYDGATIPAFADGLALSYLTSPSPAQQGLAAPSANAIPGSLLGTGPAACASSPRAGRAVASGLTKSFEVTLKR